MSTASGPAPDPGDPGGTPVDGAQRLVDDLRVAPGLAPPRAFDEACRMVVDYLADEVPMGAWLVTRVAAGRQTVLVANDRHYGLGPGAEGRWSTAMCRTMVAGTTPRVVPDTAAVPRLSPALEVASAQAVPIGAYVGTPIVLPDGDLFGTVIGLSPTPQPQELLDQEGLLDLLSSLLSAVLAADTAATDTARALERAVSEAETDALTGVLNRRGWDRWLACEEDRIRRFGDPASVVVLDLDGLKRVNDTEGHAAGDRLLARTAATLRAAVRHEDPVARLGGDEFALVAAVGADGSEPLAARLRVVLDEAGAPCSVGVAPVGVATGFVDACAEADSAMYADKRARRESRR